jgi:hypothetical protein
MQMGGNKNERTLDLAQRIEPVTEVSLLIVAFIYVSVLLLEYLPGSLQSVRWDEDLKEE